MYGFLLTPTGAEVSGERSFGVRNKGGRGNQGTESTTAANGKTFQNKEFADPSTAVALTACNTDQKETGES
jgi:hypothetical protein